MSVPRGLRKPRRVAALIPLLVALLLVGGGAIYALYQVGWQAAHPSIEEATRGTAVRHGPPPLQGELLFGLGALILLVVLAYGMWRSRTRHRSLDKLTDAATREMYGHPRQSSGQRQDGRGARP